MSHDLTTENENVIVHTSHEAHDPCAYSVTEACRRIGGISRSNFYRRIARGEIKVRKLGSRTVVMAAEVERYLNSLPPAGSR